MFDAPFVLFDEDQRTIEKILEQLVQEAHATSAFVIDKAGPLIAQSGSLVGIDTTGLASLTAGAIAATGGLAHLIGEDEFPTHTHQGIHRHVQMTLVGTRSILVVVFDDKSTLGLVKLRSRKAGARLATFFNDVDSRTGPTGSATGPFADLTDADLDHLFIETAPED